MALFKLICTDIRLKARWCYESETWKAILKTLLSDGTAAMVLYRMMQTCRHWHIEPLAMLCNKLNAICCQCIIGRGADFQAGFVLIHSQGVVINSAVRGGERIYVEHQVTIGAEQNRSPVLGSDIFIGAGAKIVGAVRIGDGARIGANAVVIDDVPPYTTVVGIPARVVKTRSSASSFSENDAAVESY
jgi:serine O-acetyltransferase